MDQADAVERIFLGESLAELSRAHREGLCRDLGLDPDEVAPTTFAGETRAFVNKLCRHLGDRHAGDPRIASALIDWVWRVEDYEAWDALMSGFRFDGKEALLRRGQILFPRALTAHWDGDG